MRVSLPRYCLHGRASCLTQASAQAPVKSEHRLRECMWQYFVPVTHDTTGGRLHAVSLQLPFRCLHPLLPPPGTGPRQCP